MRRQVNLIQGTPEWHAWRSGKIGASDVAAIMGRSIHKDDTPLKLWERRVGGIEKEVSYAMRKGSAHEEAARRAAAGITGRNFQPTCFENPLYPLNIASLDGWDEGMALEIKVPNKDDHALAARRIVPPHYVPQCQAIMLVTETPEMLYASYCPDDRSIHIVLIKRDDFLCDEIVEATKDFIDMVNDRIPPEPVESDYRHVDDVKGFSEEFREIERQEEILKSRKELLKKEMIKEVDGKNSYLGDIKITKVKPKGRVDYDRIPELLMVDLDRYRKSPIEYFRFS